MKVENEKLKVNNRSFSGFKTHAELEQAGQMLIDENGNLKGGERFLNDVKSINQDYNHNYLRTEYNQAVQSSQMAAKWQGFEKNKDFINLQYRTVNDERARASHRKLHGVTLPVDDPFWKQYTPPNGWGCRCTVVEVLKEDYPESDSQCSIAIGDEMTDSLKDKIFRFNPGIKTEVFPREHPYLPKRCGSCPLNNGKQLAIKGARGNCGSGCKVFKTIFGTQLKKITESVVGNKYLDRAIAMINKIKPTMDEHNGVLLTDKMFYTGSMRILRRSFDDVLSHQIEDNTLKDWLSDFDFDKISGWKYEGWAPCRKDPKTGKRKHPETHYFLYYSLTIKGKMYWANVKRHKDYHCEVLYTIEKDKPNDIIKGKPPYVK